MKAKQKNAGGKSNPATLDPFLMQHGSIRERKKFRNDAIDAVLINEAESPLA